MKFFKVYIFSLVILTAAGANAQEYWQSQPSPTNVWLYRCSFADTLNGWVCGDSGTIVHTSNGGLNWTLQPTGLDYFVEDICFVNKRIGWAIANDFVFYKTYILKTSNGGINWNSSPYPDSTIILSTVYFLDSLNGYMGGFNGTILKTTNAGADWSLMPVDSSLYSHFHIKNFRFFNDRIGAACGGIMDFGGIIWFTTNYGYNWKTVAVGPEPVYDVLYTDSNRAFSTGGDFEYGASFVKTFDNWNSWNYNALGFFGVGQAIAMRTTSEIWVPLAFSMQWAVSTDAGSSWVMVMNHDSNAVYDAVFVNPRNGWAAGSYGKIYKFNKNLIGLINQRKKVPVSFELYQNYPNPFNPTTKIKFSIINPAQTDINFPPSAESVSEVKLIIYDILGREIAVLVNEQLKPGTYEALWNGENYPSGIYFYSLISNGYSEAKKMILIK